MLGPAVNAIVIVICAMVGCFLVKGIPSRFEEIITKAIGLSIVYVGIKGALDNQHVLLLIISMVVGATLGELIDIDAFMKRVGDWAERRLGMGEKGSGPGGNAGGSTGGILDKSSGEVTGRASGGISGSGKERSFSKGFVSASILYCSGSMAIVGSMQSGLLGNHEILFAKSILDGAISIVFGASMGIGVVFSAIPVLIYEAAIALAAIAVRNLLTPDIIREMSAVGSLLIAAIGFNFLGIKEIKVANFIPAIFIPLVYLGVRTYFGI
ncbi:MAG: DUF554 domain-containing protein [Treponema sp.]|nr:DUF554 domain-containing protein [Treponema sp.]